MAPVDDAAPDELTRLRAEVLELRQKTAQLQGRTYVLKEGVLSRFREKMMSSGWRERHYELRVQSNGTRHLTCFTMQRTLRMTLSLSEKCVVLRESEDSGGSTGGPLHCFQVTAPSGAGPATTIRLSASTATEADAWVKALQQACFGGSDRLDESSSPSARRSLGGLLPWKSATLPCSSSSTGFRGLRFSHPRIPAGLKPAPWVS